MSENLIYYLLEFVTVPALVGLALMADFIVYCIKDHPKFDNPKLHDELWKIIDKGSGHKE